MFLIWYKFRHIKHSNTILCKHFSIKSFCAFDTCWWYNKMAYNVKSLYFTLHWCASVSQIVILYLYTWYKINCRDCDVSYVGQTKMQLNIRVKENINDIKRSIGNHLSVISKIIVLKQITNSIGNMQQF